MKISIPKNNARKNNLLKYFTGKPCPKGHISQRYIKNGKCIECLKIYNLKYRKTNKIKIEEIRKEWYEQNKEKIIENTKQYNLKHKKQRQSYIKKWNKVNRKRKNELHREWSKSNPDKIRIKNRLTKLRRKNIPGRINRADIEKLYRIKFCYYCHKKFEENEITHIDHIIPLIKGGTNNISNLIRACAKCNLTKNDKLPSEWIGADNICGTIKLNL